MSINVNAVGIDLGTTCACVGIWQNDHVKIIQNERGNRTTPSCVSFTNTRYLIGDAAKDQVITNPYNTVSNIKRFIDRRFNDVEVQNYMQQLPFKVIEKGGKPYIEVQYRGEKKQFSPEEILSMILVKMKHIAEAFLGASVENVVVAVPVGFNYSQRQAIKDATFIAGLNNLRSINEPSAAAIAYGFNNKAPGECNILTFDLGGGMFNVSLVAIEDGIYEVKAVAGNDHFGGEDFNTRLVNHLVQEFKQKFGKDLSTNAHVLYRLRVAAERAKINLSTSDQTSIEIDSLFEDIDFYASVTRARFEELNKDLFQLSLEVVQRVLHVARIDKSQVHEIVLVGGSTRIPKIREMISYFFDGKEPNTSINPDEAVAYGAAIQAAILSGDHSEKLQDLLLMEVVPFSFGIKTPDGNMMPIVERNTTIPTKKIETFSTFTDESIVSICVYEGEKPRAKDNNLLGVLELANLSPPPRDIEVIFDIDADCLLDVTAVDLKTGQRSRLTAKNRLPRQEIERMIADAEKYRADNDPAGQKKQARNRLQNYAYNLRNALQLEAAVKKKLEDSINGVIEWLNHNPEAGNEEYKYREETLKEVANSALCNCIVKVEDPNDFSDIEEVD